MSRIQRRQFVIAASALLGAPLVRAQRPGKTYRLGVFLFRQNPTPVDQTSRFERVVNLKVAKALGIALPQSVRVRADRMIE